VKAVNHDSPSDSREVRAVVRHYIRKGSLFRDNAAAQVGL